MYILFEQNKEVEGYFKKHPLAEMLYSVGSMFAVYHIAIYVLMYIYI